MYFMKEMVINNEGLLGKGRNNVGKERKINVSREKLPPTAANRGRKVAGREEEYI